MSTTLTDEVISLLRNFAEFSTWHGLANAVLAFHSARSAVDHLTYRLETLEGQSHSDDPNVRLYALTELDSVRRNLVRGEDAADRNELTILRTQVEYEKLRQLIEQQYPEFLPLPALEPLAETIELQLARAQQVEWILGQVLAKMKASGTPQYVSMDQLAAICGMRSKKTIERWLRQEKIPEPDVEGSGGKPHLWVWANVRDPLSRESERILPEVYPSFL